MNNRNEAKRVRSQFLNGLGVAALSATVLAPAAMGNLNPWVATIGLLIAVVSHVLALAGAR